MDQHTGHEAVKPEERYHVHVCT